MAPELTRFHVKIGVRRISRQFCFTFFFTNNLCLFIYYKSGPRSIPQPRVSAQFTVLRKGKGITLVKADWYVIVHICQLTKQR